MRAILIVLMLLVGTAHASPTIDNRHHNTYNNGDTVTNMNPTAKANAYSNNINKQGQLQGQLQGQGQDQSQSNRVNNNVKNTNSNTATGSGNVTSVVVEGDEHKDIPVASAASTFASVCSSGASVQRNTIGFSLSASSAFCQYLSLADAYHQFGDDTEALKYVNKAAGVANRDGFYDMIRSAITLGIL